jgi:hypothetical protein
MFDATQETRDYTRNIGRNKGKPRLWLEGEILSAHGFCHRAEWRLDVSAIDGAPCLIIALCLPDESKRRVSGKPDRPVIDITGAKLAPFVDAGKVQIIARAGHLTVTCA